MAMNYSVTSYEENYETWVSFVNVETTEQSEQWMQTHLANKPKFRQILFAS
jgi:hypothetical protein